MGVALPKPVDSAVMERHSTKEFRVGVAEMNGFRNNMEDAHLIHMRNSWGFFGVFDGHGGEQCSKYVADHLRGKLEESGCPKDDEEVKAFILDTDKAFLDTAQPSGSTAAMCIVHKPTHGGKHRLRVVNAGDSRVLLGRRDGTIVDGGGTDQGLTTDHKPNHPSERERIYRCGGTVEEAAGGVHRVNGDLAVSRGFGDAEYKKTGGPGPEDRPVTANPELGHFECDDTDFLIIVCDGVSEGDFSNQQVVELVADKLKERDDEDLCAIARAVCLRAIETNSKDNITCMIVVFTPKDGKLDGVEFVPGPIYAPDNNGFMKAYSSMAARAGYSLEDAACLRYEQLLDELADASMSAAKLEVMQAEKEKYGTVPESKEERKAYFKGWLEEKEGGNNGGQDSQLSSMLAMLQGGGTPPQLNQSLMSQAGKQAIIGKVRVKELDTLKPAVDAHPKLQWDDRLKDIAGKLGGKVRDDPSDDTSQVTFEDQGFTCWLPTESLIDENDTGLA